MCDDLDQIAETSGSLNESTARPVTHQVLTNRDHSRALGWNTSGQGHGSQHAYFQSAMGIKKSALKQSEMLPGQTSRGGIRMMIWSLTRALLHPVNLITLLLFFTFYIP